MKALLITALVVVLALVVAGQIAVRTVHIHSSEGANGTDVAIQTPIGKLDIRANDHMSPAVVGVPVYPGAYRVNGSGGAHISWSSSDGANDKNLYVVGGDFRTSDSVDRVVNYYRTQLPNLMVVSEPERGTRLEYKEGGFRRIIAISERHGETRIGVASITERASN